jgi:hypothetical protein
LRRFITSNMKLWCGMGIAGEARAGARGRNSSMLLTFCGLYTASIGILSTTPAVEQQPLPVAEVRREQHDGLAVAGEAR